MSEKLKSERQSLRLWLRLLACTRMVENQIRSDLRESFDTTLPRFDVMAQLYRYSDGLRMSEISALLMVTGGNITGIIDQLEQENLAERKVDPKDRRAYIVKLTENGLKTFESMSKVHHTWIADLTNGLDETEQQAMHQLLTKLYDSLQEKMRKNE